MPYELKSKTIVVCGEQLVVFEASNLMDVNRSMMVAEADEKWKGNLDDGTELQSRRYLETLLYPSLVACTKGNVPTLEEFVNGMPATEIVGWTAAATEMNPRWFPDLAVRTPEEKVAELEKNE